MYTVALIGKICSGKSMISELLSQRGAFTIDFDQLSREQLSAGSPCEQDVIAYFGPSILDSKGKLDRKKLAGLVFSNKETLATLEEIEIPYIVEAAKTALNNIKASTSNNSEEDVLVFLQIPKPELVKDFLQDPLWVDEIVYVAADFETRKTRALKLRKMEEADFVARDAAQLSEGELEALADVRLSNNDEEMILTELNGWLQAHNRCPLNAG